MVRLWWLVLLLICGVLADKGTKSSPDEKNNPGDEESLEEKPNQVQTTKEEEKVQPNIIFVLVRQSLIATNWSYMLNYHFFKTQVDDVGWADFNYNTEVGDEIVSE